jgi:hypothetical protein
MHFCFSVLNRSVSAAPWQVLRAANHLRDSNDASINVRQYMRRIGSTDFNNGSKGGDFLAVFG